MQVKSESERENLGEEVEKLKHEGTKVSKQWEIRGFVANNEMNNSRRRVMELLGFW
jgi:hypothetical protein